MTFKHLVLSSLILSTSYGFSVHAEPFVTAKTSQAVESSQKEELTQKQAVEVQAGHYLASRFAQNKHDWSNAAQFLGQVTELEQHDLDLTIRSMILAMGSGNVDKAFQIANQLEASSKENTIIGVFRVVDAFANEDYKRAKRILKSLPDDGTLKFIGPFVNAWLQAAQGKVNVSDLQDNTIQLYHGILISDFLDDHSDVEKIIDKALKVEDINSSEIERIADLYGHVGLNDKALDLYKKVLTQTPDDQAILAKIALLETGNAKPLFKKIETPHQGMAQAFHDIANILYNENNDESARVFGHIALHLSPQKTETRFLLGDISARHKHYDAAIDHYNRISKQDEYYLKAQHKIVDIYDQSDRYDEALQLLNQLLKKQKDTDTYLKIGDVHRHQKNYKKALKAYNQAVKHLGDEIPEDYWHIHYVRGIAYEQSDNWPEAEKELKAALAFQPNHPYVLNYLGYAWADQDVHLDKALDMIQKAVDLRPSDGYITDSLGWVLYRTQDYSGAVRWLERAVELLPYDPTINDHLGLSLIHISEPTRPY